jgi:glycolate oxidase iron-sulfur subunit
MRRNIDAWWPLVEKKEVEAIIVTASGCGVTVKEYGHLLRYDSVYAGKAATISTLAKDISEILHASWEICSTCLVRNTLLENKVVVSLSVYTTAWHANTRRC